MGGTGTGGTGLPVSISSLEVPDCGPSPEVPDCGPSPEALDCGGALEVWSVELAQRVLDK